MNFLKSFHFVVVVFIFLALSACSSSGGGDSNTSSSGAATTGRVSLLITDGISDKFDQVNLTVQSISFLSDDDSNETVVFDQPQVINLLALQNYSNLLVTTVIPTGVYKKIRLQISQVELLKFAGEGNKAESYLAKLPANGKVDLNPRGSFEVFADGHLMIELDVDAGKSILASKKANGKTEYSFRPIVFVNIVGVDDGKTKLVLLDGVVQAREGAGFQLCSRNKKYDDHEKDDDDDHDHEGKEGDDEDDDHEGKNDDDDHDGKENDDHESDHDDEQNACMAVVITDNTVVQDDLIEVVSADSVVDGNVVTVLGKANGYSIHALHIVIESNNKKVSELALFTGDATSAADAENNFTMNTDDKNAVIQALAALTVSLVDGSGARVFDRNGSELTTDDIIAGSAVDVFGLAIPDIISAAKVKAAFVIVDNNVADNKISGTIAAINTTESQLTVTTVTDTFSGDVCVDVSQASIFLLAIADGKVISNEITINKLQPAMLINAYGQDEGLSCVVADVVLVSQPLAVEPVAASLFVSDD